MVKYYNGDKLILLNDKEKVGDERANYRAYGNIREMFLRLWIFKTFRKNIIANYKKLFLAGFHMLYFEILPKSVRSNSFEFK